MKWVHENQIQVDWQLLAKSINLFIGGVGVVWQGGEIE